jgi:hypothetical protein
MAETPFDTAAYLGQRNSVNRQAQTARDRIQYDRTQFDAMRRLADQSFQSSWNQRQARVPVGMSRRGLRNSGVYGRALATHFAERTAADFARQADLARQSNAFDWQLTDVAEQRTQALARLEAERAARRQQLASQLQQFRSN